jgi:2-desacetyl-2-hydroxyethyl bacteriochlorophyllide A dehydrogenase
MWYGGDDLRYEDIPDPQISDDEVLIKIAYAGICGSEIHMLDGVIPKEVISPPAILGHEISGTVAKVGKNVTEYRVGDRVTAHPWVGCGGCYFCKRAQENFCQNPSCFLLDPRGGAFAEYTPVEAKQVYKIPDDMSLKLAALVEPVSIAVHTIDLSRIKPGFSVAVLGSGTIGLACLILAQRAGASLTIISDLADWKLEIARKYGADIAVNPDKEDLKKAVMDATGGMGVDSCIEAVGVKATYETSISIIKNGGQVLAVGVARPDFRWEISPFEVLFRQIAIQGVFWSPYSFPRTLSLISKLDVEPLVTHTFHFQEIQKALAVQRKGEGIKVLLEP